MAGLCVFWPRVSLWRWSLILVAQGHLANLVLICVRKRSFLFPKDNWIQGDSLANWNVITRGHEYFILLFLSFLFLNSPFILLHFIFSLTTFRFRYLFYLLTMAKFIKFCPKIVPSFLFQGAYNCFNMWWSF